jgi:hypothetical protein
MIAGARRFVLCCAAGLLAAACSTPAATMPPGPPPYRIGFKDGCDAGYAYAGSPFYTQVAAAEPASTAEPYATGWRAGFEECKDNYQRIQRTLYDVLGPP